MLTVPSLLSVLRKQRQQLRKYVLEHARGTVEDAKSSMVRAEARQEEAPCHLETKTALHQKALRAFEEITELAEILICIKKPKALGFPDEEEISDDPPAKRRKPE